LDTQLHHVITTFLKPGGFLYVIGEGHYEMKRSKEYYNDDDDDDNGEQLFGDILNLLDSVKSVSVCFVCNSE
jgi:hypothetical protein